MSFLHDQLSKQHGLGPRHSLHEKRPSPSRSAFSCFIISLVVFFASSFEIVTAVPIELPINLINVAGEVLLATTLSLDVNDTCRSVYDQIREASVKQLSNEGEDGRLVGHKIDFSGPGEGIMEFMNHHNIWTPVLANIWTPDFIQQRTIGGQIPMDVSVVGTRQDFQESWEDAIARVTRRELIDAERKPNSFLQVFEIGQENMTMQDILGGARNITKFPNAQRFEEPFPDAHAWRPQHQWSCQVNSPEGVVNGKAQGRSLWRDDFYAVGVVGRRTRIGSGDPDPVTLFGPNQEDYSLQGVSLEKVVVSRISDTYHHSYGTYYARLQKELAGFPRPPLGTNVTFYFRETEHGALYHGGQPLQPKNKDAGARRPIHAKAISLEFGSNQAEKWNNIELARAGTLDFIFGREAARRGFLSQIGRHVAPLLG